VFWTIVKVKNKTLISFTIWKVDCYNMVINSKQSTPEANSPCIFQDSLQKIPHKKQCMPQYEACLRNAECKEKYAST